MPRADACQTGIGLPRDKAALAMRDVSVHDITGSRDVRPGPACPVGLGSSPNDQHLTAKCRTNRTTRRKVVASEKLHVVTAGGA